MPPPAVFSVTLTRATVHAALDADFMKSEELGCH